MTAPRVRQRLLGPFPLFRAAAVRTTVSGAAEHAASEPSREGGVVGIAWGQKSEGQ